MIVVSVGVSISVRGCKRCVYVYVYAHASQPSWSARVFGRRWAGLHRDEGRISAACTRVQWASWAPDGPDGGGQDMAAPLQDRCAPLLLWQRWSHLPVCHLLTCSKLPLYKMMLEAFQRLRIKLIYGRFFVGKERCILAFLFVLAVLLWTYINKYMQYHRWCFKKLFKCKVTETLHIEVLLYFSLIYE